MARTSVICETPDVVGQLVEMLKSNPRVSVVGRIKNGYGSTAVGRGGYRDIKVNLQPSSLSHFAEIQVRVCFVSVLCVLPLGPTVCLKFVI